jgi:LysM repeat protein
MSVNLRAFLRVGTLLLLLLALIVAAQPPSAHAEPSSDGIVYVVKPGDRLVDIAARYGVSASAIVRANGLANADTIFPGQKLIIPGVASSATNTPGPATAVPTRTPVPTLPGPANPIAAPSTLAPTATSTSTVAPAARDDSNQQPTVYTVQLGDTLASIARQFGIGAAALAKANNITNPDLIWVGQTLTLPGPGNTNSDSGNQVGTPSATATPAATAEPTAVPLPTQKLHVVQPGETLSQIARKYGVTVDAIVAANGLGSADVIGVGVRLLIPGVGDTGSGGSALSAIKPTKFVASISQQRCWLYNGETVIARWVCSTGRRGSPSVPGTYKVQSKLPKAYGSTWNIWMPFWLGIYWAGASENGIHGLPWDAKTGVQIWSGNVGKPITFGCIMLDNVNAKMLYDMAWIGMPVVVLP